MNHSTGIVIHINEQLDGSKQEKLSNDVCHFEGVVSADVNENRPHLMIVGYDPEETKPYAVLSRVRNIGLHAQLVAWL